MSSDPPKLPEGVNAQTPKAKLDRARQEAEAIDLVNRGYNFREIAERLKCSVATAHKRYVNGRNAIPREMAEHVLAEVRETARAVRLAHWDRRHDTESGKLILLADKNILATLPTKTEVTGKDGAPLPTSTLMTLTDEQLSRIARGQPAGDAGGGDSRAPTPDETED